MKNEYWYDLPERLIAQEPANPRDTSKLLVYDTQSNQLIIDQFFNFATYLPPSTALTLNDAKVVPARVTLTKETGGKIVVLLLINEWIASPNGPIPCFLDRKAGIGDRLYFHDKSFVTVQRQDEGLFFVSWEGSSTDLLAKLDKYGVMPIPPYIKHSPLSRDALMEKYQTVFAKSPGSSAAPTASLHFTKRVFDAIAAKGIQKITTTLHVGLGTFAPLTEKNLQENKLHSEWYEVSAIAAEELKKAKDEHKKICAVGTTVVRTLESYAKEGVLGKPYAGNTELFIRPGYEFKLVDMLSTNFHLPSTSLMMLVDAFLAYKKAPKRILELYKYAEDHEFRFYSFGDTMLIL